MAYGFKKYTEPATGTNVLFDDNTQAVKNIDPTEGSTTPIGVSANPWRVQDKGGTLTNGQVSVDTTAGGVEIVAAAAGRQGVVIANQGSVACYVGTGTVSTTNGFLLQPGESVGIPSDSAIKGITASSSTTIGYLAVA